MYNVQCIFFELESFDVMVSFSWKFKDPVARNNPDLHFNRAMVRFPIYWGMAKAVKSLNYSDIYF